MDEARVDGPRPEQLEDWIVDCLCVAESAERRRDWDLYRDAVRELNSLCASYLARSKK